MGVLRECRNATDIGLEEQAVFRAFDGVKDPLHLRLRLRLRLHR